LCCVAHKILLLLPPQAEGIFKFLIDLKSAFQERERIVLSGSLLIIIRLERIRDIKKAHPIDQMSFEYFDFLFRSI